LGDVRDAGYVADRVAGMDLVFHLAALISIPHSYHAPSSYLETNVNGTLNVLEAVRRHGTPRLVQTSTSEVYGTPDQVPITEDHPLKGQSPYSASKIAADKFCEAYHRSFQVPVVTLRPFNTFGPRQSIRAVIPTILVQLLAGRKRIELGALDPRRDFTYTEDTIEGFIAAGTVPGIEGTTIHLGTGTDVSIRELFEYACRAVNVEASVHQKEERMRPAASEVMVLRSDPSYAAEKLGWRPRVSLEEGLARTARWLQDNQHQYNLGILFR
jgi:UDP-glucose 4-epimerase